MKSSKWFRRIVLVSTLAGAAAVTVSQSAAQENNKPVAAEPSSAAAQPAAQPEGDYVGSEVCVTCHADQEKSFVHTIMGNAMAQKNPEEYLAKDFTTLMETMAQASNMKLTSENKDVPTGLE